MGGWWGTIFRIATTVTAKRLASHRQAGYTGGLESPEKVRNWFVKFIKFD